MRIVEPETTAKLRARFSANQLHFVQTELRVAIQMARIAHTEFLLGDVAHARRASNVMRAARDSAVRFLPNLQRAGLSAEAKESLDAAIDQLRSAVAQVEEWEEAEPLKV
jgi:hypothetical protein